MLDGKIELTTMIEKIKIINSYIRIIIILEKENKELENILISKGNIYIFYNNKVEIKEIAKLMINRVDTQKLENEIDKLKKLVINSETQNEIEERENENLSDKEIINIQKQIEKEYKEEKQKYKINIFNNAQERKAKIILVLGLEGIGKSIFTVNMAQALKHIKKQTLIIDLDNTNNSIKTLFGIKKSSNSITREIYNKNQEIDKNEIVIKINKNTDLLSINKLVQKQQTDINKLQLTKNISELKNKYDAIIIDTKTQEDYKNIESEEIDKIIFLTEANILQIKKTKKVLKEYITHEKIDKQKVNILFNKNKEDSIDFYILKDIFKEYNILGKIDNIKNCNTLINENMKTIYLEKRIKKQYSKIAKCLLRNNSLKQYYINRLSN